MVVGGDGGTNPAVLTPEAAGHAGKEYTSMLEHHNPPRRFSPFDVVIFTPKGWAHSVEPATKKRKDVTTDDQPPHHSEVEPTEEEQFTLGLG